VATSDPISASVGSSVILPLASDLGFEQASHGADRAAGTVSEM
jgi:hypothetical protein